VGDRLRCSNCEGHVAYECDKKFEEEALLRIFDEVLDERPVREFDPLEEGLVFTDYAPGTPFAIDRASRRRTRQNQDFQKELQVELECELSPDQLTISLYDAVELLRADRPDEIAVFKQGVDQDYAKFVNRSSEKD